jgi:hypothetical protein
MVGKCGDVWWDGGVVEHSGAAPPQDPMRFPFGWDCSSWAGAWMWFV